MRSIFNKIGWFIKQEWKLYLLMFFLLIFISVLALAPAYVLGKAIDVLISGALTKDSLVLLVALLVLLPVTRYFSSFLFHFLVNKTANKLTYQLRHNYLSHLFEMDLDFFETYHKGDLIARITNDLEAITVAATQLLEGIVFNVGIVLFAIGIMSFTISWELTLISVTIMPVALTFLNIIRFKKRRYIRKHREIYSEMTEIVLESVEGQKTLRAYGQQKSNLDKQYKAIDRDIESWRYIVNYENWFNPLFEVVYGISYILAFGFGIFFIINQKISVGELVTFVSYIGMLYGPIISMSTIFTQLNNATISVDRYDEILKTQAKVKDEQDAKHILSFKEIEFKDVVFKYPFDKNPVIKNISFSIKNGQTIGIVGPTGSGKSTLIRQLLREFNVTSGSILIDGNDIQSYKVEAVRDLVGYVPQAHVLFKRAVDENILMGNPNANQNMLDKAVKIADFEKDLLYLHDGLNTMVGESGTTLSGGQKQRLSIARALIKDPEILILDDSLSAVDAKTEENIIDRLKEFRSNKTNIIVAHRFSAVRDAHTIYVLENGEITQKGTHAELIRQEGWYKHQYIQQMTMK
jgi:ATP-binding cassette subfamily B protein